MTLPLDLEDLQRKHRSYFPEQLSVDYTLLGSFDNESLYAFLMHGPKDDGDVVCVDEKPDELDGPPSPRLEAISEIINSFPALIAELKEALEALGWYADRENYVDGPSISEGVYVPYYPILDDRGQRARKAIGASDEN